MPEGGRGGPGSRCRETDHSQQDAKGTKSESHEGARIKEAGLRRGIFFHGDFPLLAAVEIVADNSKTSPSLDAFFFRSFKISCRKQPPARSRSMSFAVGPPFRSSDGPNEYIAASGIASWCSRAIESQ